MNLNLKKADLDFSKVCFDVKYVQCPFCKNNVALPMQSSDFDMHEKYQDHINDLYKAQDAIIIELQEFFPDVPIADYFKMQNNELQDCLSLLFKRLNEPLSKIEEIRLNNNFWIKKIKENNNDSGK